MAHLVRWEGPHCCECAGPFEVRLYDGVGDLIGLYCRLCGDRELAKLGMKEMEERAKARGERVEWQQAHVFVAEVDGEPSEWELDALKGLLRRFLALCAGTEARARSEGPPYKFLQVPRQTIISLMDETRQAIGEPPS